MSEKILVPVLGESITEATVSKWLKNKGDKVEADEPVVELETDKVNLEVPSPVSGILTEINSKDGEVVEVGALLGKVLEKASEKLNKIEIKKVESKSLKENNIVNLEVSSKKPKVFNDKNDQEEKPLVLIDEDEAPFVLTDEVNEEKTLDLKPEDQTLPPSVRKIVLESIFNSSSNNLNNSSEEIDLLYNINICYAFDMNQYQFNRNSIEINRKLIEFY